MENFEITIRTTIPSDSPIFTLGGGKAEDLIEYLRNLFHDAEDLSIKEMEVIRNV